MKTTPSLTFAGCLLSLGLPFALLPHLRAELKETPLLLAKQGSYIELEEGYYQRCESIEHVSGTIDVSYNGKDHTIAHRFPLDSKGLAEFKNLTGTELKSIACHVEVRIQVNAGVHTVIISEGEDPNKNWEPFAAAVDKAMAQMKRLVALASPPEPTPNQTRPRVISPAPSSKP